MVGVDEAAPVAPAAHEAGPPPPSTGAASPPPVIPKSIISQLSEMLHSLKTITYEVASDPAKSAEMVADLKVVFLKYQALKVHDVG